MDLSTLLQEYHTEFPEEVDFKNRCQWLLDTYENAFERSLALGHFTASAWILNEDRSKVLLTHHAKLDRWLQLGGHADGEKNLLQVALKEAHEESGLQDIKILSDNIFDIDIHIIPANKKEEKHEHFDIRFLFESDENENLVLNHESNQLKWIPLEKIGDLVGHNPSIMRMVEKTTGNLPIY
jgi:8-oxo-dGTP pyrophosphatase MutT (NUDIX family)